ncbi:MAG: S1 RNA-binding domain-containing protein [SAR202 cluster bacterium]|nr:S1 RNA-binding domain-containing protein [SAR202 cluster bacterium]
MTTSDQNQDTSLDMGELLDQMKPLKPLRRGDVVEGSVMRADSDGILVHVGHKAEGIVPAGEMRTVSAEERDNISVGDSIITYVVKGETLDNAAILSVDKAVGEKGWPILKKAIDSDETVAGKVIGFNRGGAIVEVEGIQGFVPMSQLASIPRQSIHNQQSQDEETAGIAEPSSDRESDVSPEIGKELTLKVLELDRDRNRAIFSERKVVMLMRDEQKAKLIEELVEGEVRRGRVTGISSFGAFVDLGGADGLIHISELSWDTITTPEDVVSVGDELDVHILKVDSQGKKIALSLKRLKPEPWETIEEKFHVGDIVNAKVTKLTNFGAFARLEDSVEGLIHISELTSRAITHPREVVGEKEVVRLKILRIEPERRRLGLSLKQAREEEG